MSLHSTGASSASDLASGYGSVVGPGHNLKAVSLFAGVGGFDLAAQRAGIQPLATAEIDKNARAVLARQFPHAHHYDDVRKVSRDGLLRDVGAVPDLVLGGFPCQDLSVAGKGAGLAGARSGLFYEAVRVAEECRAEWVVIENVPGLLSSNGGRDMGAVLGALAECGYGVAYRVLDAQYFGLAQRRRRVFIVGRLGDDGSAPAEVLALAEGSLGHPAPSRTQGQAAAGPAGDSPVGAGVEGVVSTLMGGGQRGYRVGAEEAAGGQIVVQNAYGEPARTLNTSQGRLADAEDNLIVHSTSVMGDVAHTLTSEGADASEDGTGRGTPVVTYRKSKRAQTVEDDEPWVEDDKTNTINLFDTGDTRATSLVVEPLAFHLTQDPTHGDVVPCPSKNSTGQGVQTEATVRRLTPTECERLQGFPDGWTAGQADSHRYRQMGNAVAVPCVEWVLTRLLAVARAEVAA